MALQEFIPDNQNNPIMMFVDSQRHLYDLNPDYQREDVWDITQRLLLVKSLLERFPIAAFIMAEKTAADGYGFTMVDGKQRMETIHMFVDGELAIPYEWVDNWDVLPEHAAEVADTGIVTVPQLDPGFLQFVKMINISVLRFDPSRSWNGNGWDHLDAEAAKQAEVDIYLRCNTGGTADSDADLERARKMQDGSRDGC